MMAEETKGQTPEKPVDESKPKPTSRPPAVPVNTSFRFALQRNEQRLDDSSDIEKLEEKLEDEK